MHTTVSMKACGIAAAAALLVAPAPAAAELCYNVARIFGGGDGEDIKWKWGDWDTPDFTDCSKVELTGSGFGDAGMIAMANELRYSFENNPDVTIPDTFLLPSNEITDKGAIAFAEVLKLGVPVKLLDINSNMIGDEGALALADALEANIRFKTLKIFRNVIGEAGAARLKQFGPRKIGSFKKKVQFEDQRTLEEVANEPRIGEYIMKYTDGGRPGDAGVVGAPPLERPKGTTALPLVKSKKDPRVEIYCPKPPCEEKPDEVGDGSQPRSATPVEIDGQEKIATGTPNPDAAGQQVENVVYVSSPGGDEYGMENRGSAQGHCDASSGQCGGNPGKTDYINPMYQPELDTSPFDGDMDPEVDAALAKLKMAKYRGMFGRQEIDYETFTTMTEADLNDIGITLFGPRRKLVKAIQAINSARAFEEKEAAMNAEFEAENRASGSAPTDTDPEIEVEE